MNLIPEKIPETGNYYCTWAAQSRIRPADRKDETVEVRDNMREDVLFGKNGLLSGYMKEVRSDLIVLLDDGWDVPLGTENPGQTGMFGSLELDEGRFPSFRGDPTERLKRLADYIKSLGYKGVGLWIACQRPFSPGDPVESAEDARRYWEEKAEMSRKAGISYWKVDWGRMACDAGYREMMTECARKYAPGLAIEHFPLGIEPPFGKYVCGESTFTEGELEYNRRVFAASDYLRTYDVLGEFANSMSLNRAGLLLQGLSEIGADTQGILNIEDSSYLGAGLGCAIGVMRHERYEVGRERPDTKRYTETVRAVKWQRIAPPFALGGSFEISDEILTDSRTFPPRDPDSWPFVAGKTKTSKAPAAISRNCPLPVAFGEVKPLLAASRGESGAYSIAALNRTVNNEVQHYFAADVFARVGESRDIGVFGRYSSLTLDFDFPLDGRRIMMQDLCTDTAADVTSQVERETGRLIIPGWLIDRVCEGNLRPTDDSAPGVVIRITD